MIMPNAKTHFIAGAVVGATVNVLVQSTQMAMDYDRPFDWGEFFLCTGAGAFAANPKGIASIARPTFGSPGLASVGQSGEDRAYPGFAIPEPHNPERVASAVHLSTFRQFFHSLLTAALVAWAISGKHTLKFSRATRLALWVFGIGYLSHIALDCATPKRINPI